MIKYYKLVDYKGAFIGVCTSSDFRRFQKKHKIILRCDESLGQYVWYNGKLYRSNWLVPTITDTVEYIACDIIQIEEDVYNTLCRAIENNENIEFEAEEVVEEEETDVIEEDVTIEFVRDSKISEMKSMCNKAITNGFDVVLGDGNTHHFSLSIHDQLNLVSMMACGDSEIWYHGDGERNRIFSKEDTKLIFYKYMDHKNYHTTYFNAIKAYINSLTDMNDIDSVEYGMEIPEGFKPNFLSN